MSIWKFSITGNIVKYGDEKRNKVTKSGCNEPFKNRFWCPKLHWFRNSPCPFSNRNECESFASMCGAL